MGMEEYTFFTTPKCALVWWKTYSHILKMDFFFFPKYARPYSYNIIEYMYNNTD